MEALRDSKQLEGKMNGATAQVWRDFMDDTGGNAERPLPQWLQQSKARTDSQDSNQSGESSDTSGSTSEGTTTE